VTRLRCLRELSLRRVAPVLSESPSRSGKEVSPQRDNAKAIVSLFQALALAKGARLSKRSPLPERELGEIVL